MGFCIKCGGPTKDDQTICENCSSAQQQSESEVTPAEEIKLVPIQELNETQTSPEPAETVLSPEGKSGNTKTVKIIAIVASALVVLTGAFFVGKAFFGRDIMQLVIGKSRYAQNLENASAQMITKQLVASIDKSVSLTKAANQDKAMEMELSNKISIEDAYYTQMNLGSEGTAAVKQAVSYLNSLSFKDIAHTKAGNMQSLIALSDKAGTVLNMNLSARKGNRIAIVGPTGCGKTTIINLLMRFYDADSGTIKIDGTDINKVTRSSLRAMFGMVLQETWLFSGTVRDNITYGSKNISDEQMIAASKAAHAHSFIMRLPNGYDTLISEDGGNISQGQRQLLCIARVMLFDPPILILDEATSSIDTRTEIRIQKAFTKMMKGRTSFIVAHRLSTIKEADMILVMNKGSIIEQGTHEQLLEKNGFYASLYNSQFAVMD